MQAVIVYYILIKMAREWRFNPSVYRAKGDRLVHRAVPVSHNEGRSDQLLFFGELTVVKPALTLVI